VRSSALAAVVAALLVAVAPARGVADAPARSIDRPPRVRRQPPEIATYFEANRGQTAPQVEFVARCAGYIAFLTPGGATFATDAAAFRMRFVGASETSHAHGLESAPGRSNYFIGNDPSKWTTDVPHFARVACNGVLPGVDVVWRGDGRAIAYDVSLAPGVDPSNVRLRFEGADAVALDDRGDVVLTIAGGTAPMSAPRAYQDLAAGRRDVAAAYVVGADGEVGFRVGAHDPTRRLVIDPSFTVSTFFGGVGSISVAMAIDSSDDVFLTGTAQPANFPVTAGVYKTSGVVALGVTVVFITKFAPAAASLVYSTYVSGTNSGDISSGIAVDSSGNAYVGGDVYSTDFPLVRPFLTSGPGFLFKLSPAGDSLIWSTRLSNHVTRLRLDASSAIHVLSSWSASQGGPYTIEHAMKVATAGPSLVYDVNLNHTAALLMLYDIAVDPSGAAWVAGMNPAAGQASSSALQPTYGGGTGDAWIARLGASGAVEYATYLGGSGYDVATSLSFDSWGDLFVSGTTTSVDFPVVRAYQTSNAGGGDFWAARLNVSANSLVWCTYFGGPSSESGGACATNGLDEICVVGVTGASGFPTLNAPQGAYGGGPYDGVVAEFSSDGTLEQSSFLGGSGYETFKAVAFDNSGAPFVAGSTGSIDFPTTAQAFQATAPFTSTGGVSATITGFPKSASTYTDVGPVDLPPATVGAAYSGQLAVGGGVAPLTWSVFVGPLPAGLSLSPSGALTGTPSSVGSVSFMARVVDAAGSSAARRFRSTVNPAPVIPTATLPAWTVGRPYSAPLTATGGTPPLTWTLKTGTLPPGATVDSTGLVKSTALSQVGTFTFVVQCFDAWGVGAAGSVTMTVDPAPRITTPTPTDGTEFRPIELKFDVADGTPPFAWSVASGAAPVDQPIDAKTGTIKGSATQSGDYAFTVRATDVAGAAADRDYTMHVNAAPFIQTTELPWAARNRPYSFVVKRKGGTPPYAWSVAGNQVAPGIAIVPAAGELVGTPTKGGRFPFTCRCSDTRLAFDERAFTLVVADALDLAGRGAVASKTIDFKTSAGAPALRYVELLAGAELTIVVARRGALPVAVKLYDASQTPVDLGDALTTTKGRSLVKKFRVPATGRYFIELTPDASFKGRVSLRVQAPPRTRWTGTATLDASEAPVVVPFLAPPGAKLSARVTPARRSKARPTISSVTDAAASELLVSKERRESKTGATLVVKTPLVGGDCALTIAPRGGFAGDVAWTVTLALPRRFSFELPSVPTSAEGK